MARSNMTLPSFCKQLFARLDSESTCTLISKPQNKGPLGQLFAE